MSFGSSSSHLADRFRAQPLDAFTSISRHRSRADLLSAVMLASSRHLQPPQRGHFGVHGRLIGSSLTLLVAIGSSRDRLDRRRRGRVGIGRYYHMSVGKNVQALGAAIICARPWSRLFWTPRDRRQRKAISSSSGRSWPPYWWYSYRDTTALCRRHAAARYILAHWFLSVRSASSCRFPMRFEGDYSRHIPRVPVREADGGDRLGIFAGCW